MCEILFFADDKELCGNDEIDRVRFRAGDVIMVKPDGHVWGLRELDNPAWRILKLPKVTVEQAEYLVKREVGNGDEQVLRQRGVRLMIEHHHHGAKFKAWIGDTLRTAQTLTENYTFKQLHAFTQVKPRLTHPDVFE